MKRPNKSDYTTTNQREYDRKLNEYYRQLEKYCDYLESKLKNYEKERTKSQN
jgi:hypothetical protein